MSWPGASQAYFHLVATFVGAGASSGIGAVRRAAGCQARDIPSGLAFGGGKGKFFGIGTDKILLVFGNVPGEERLPLAAEAFVSGLESARAAVLAVGEVLRPCYLGRSYEARTRPF